MSSLVIPLSVPSCFLSIVLHSRGIEKRLAVSWGKKVPDWSTASFKWSQSHHFVKWFNDLCVPQPQGSKIMSSFWFQCFSQSAKLSVFSRNPLVTSSLFWCLSTFSCYWLESSLSLHDLNWNWSTQKIWLSWWAVMTSNQLKINTSRQSHNDDFTYKSISL